MFTLNFIHRLLTSNHSLFIHESISSTWRITLVFKVDPAYGQSRYHSHSYYSTLRASVEIVPLLPQPCSKVPPKEHTEYNINVWKFYFDDWMKLITVIHCHKTHTGLRFLLLFNPKLGNAYYLIQPWCCKLRTLTPVQ